MHTFYLTGALGVNSAVLVAVADHGLNGLPLAVHCYLDMAQQQCLEVLAQRLGLNLYDISNSDETKAGCG